MNFSAILGVMAALAVTYFTVTSSKSSAVFFDVHGMVIVIGGTFTVALLCFPFGRLFGACKIVFRKMLGKSKAQALKNIGYIVTAAQAYRTNPKSALDGLPKDAHPFLMDAMKYLIESGFNAHELDDILSNAIDAKKKRDNEEIKVWQTIARFPPAFGLLGATVGMISLLQTLSEPGAQDHIGGHMATALVATFYGLVCANLIFIPIGENLAEVSAEDLVIRKVIREGVLLLQQKKHPLYIEEFLKCFLAPSQRNVEMSAGGKGGTAKAA